MERRLLFCMPKTREAEHHTGAHTDVSVRMERRLLLWLLGVFCSRTQTTAHMDACPRLKRRLLCWRSWRFSARVSYDRSNERGLSYDTPSFFLTFIDTSFDLFMRPYETPSFSLFALLSCLFLPPSFFNVSPMTQSHKQAFREFPSDHL